MKRSVLLCAFSLIVTVCNAQEWFTSFDVAQRLARVQNKMLFVIWEDAFNYSIPMFTVSDNGKAIVIDVSKDTSFDSIIWDYFIPVKLQESEYANFSNEAKDRSIKYIDKLNDDSVKIMDVNGHILNVADTTNNIMNLSLLISRYALNTTYLSSDLENYAHEPTFLTSFLLSMRYIDFAIFADEQLRPEPKPSCKIHDLFDLIQL